MENWIAVARIPKLQNKREICEFALYYCREVKLIPRYKRVHKQGSTFCKSFLPDFKGEKHTDVAQRITKYPACKCMKNLCWFEQYYLILSHLKFNLLVIFYIYLGQDAKKIPPVSQLPKYAQVKISVCHTSVTTAMNMHSMSLYCEEIQLKMESRSPLTHFRN